MVSVAKINNKQTRIGDLGGSQSCNHKEMNSANDLQELGTGPCASSENTAHLTS